MSDAAPRVLRASGSELAQMIRTGEVKSRSVVEAHIDQARRVNPRVNALVAQRFDTALAEADRADTAPSEAPFHGVPCTVKECFALSGMPQTSGLVSRGGVVAEADAPAVALLRAAGAIPLGVTNVSELCMWMEANNRVYGRTRNPYDPARTSGGSSGGEAALVAAGGSPFGIGSDVGGSIRMPAAFCGVFGHKPSPGLVENTGQYPNAENEAQRYLATGPIARSATDLAPLLEVISAVPVGAPDPMSALDVYLVEPRGIGRIDPEVLSAVRLAAAVLEENGARVVTAELAALRHSFDIWSAMMNAAAGTSFRELLAGGGELRPGREFVRSITGRTKFTVPALGLAAIEALPGRVAPGRERRMRELGAVLRDELHELLGPHGVLLYPPYPTVAPRHGRALLPPVRWAGTAIFNVLDTAVTQAPIGLDRRGLPLGVQIVGMAGTDANTIAVARVIEDALGGWAPPSARIRVRGPRHCR